MFCQHYKYTCDIINKKTGEILYQQEFSSDQQMSDWEIKNPECRLVFKYKRRVD